MSWKQLHNDFNALKEAEDGIARERVPAAHCYAYVIYSESGEVGCWVEDVPSESLGARFALAASEAGIALGCPQGTPPEDYWLSRLSLDLRENGSEHLRMYSSTAGMIEGLFEASAIFCSRLEQRAIESPADLAAKLAASRVEESIDERSARRCVVILPILKAKRWTRSRWAIQAGVSKNCVYEYLSGKRDLITENREAMAEVLELRPEELPR